MPRVLSDMLAINFGNFEITTSGSLSRARRVTGSKVITQEFISDSDSSVVTWRVILSADGTKTLYATSAGELTWGGENIWREGNFDPDSKEKAAALNTVSTASSDLDAAWASDYTRFTHSAGAKTLNVRANATHAVPTMAKFPGRNAAANNLTIAPAGGVTINAPAGGTLVIPPQGTFTLVKVATDEWDLFGETVPA